MQGAMSMEKLQLKYQLLAAELQYTKQGLLLIDLVSHTRKLWRNEHSRYAFSIGNPKPDFVDGWLIEY